ncbi:DHH family protein [Coniochaeta ligniaria NRRL 30616]|uniref:DHH family protein n=1 Tax=Coniochaeta ligniaria NRRL 30616 TaxID=1408157 RepID=A0A1J7IL41_9PEZI|nr:DHH family protein [Coniochaeta ligniaria NRRL 30616]
MKRTLPLSPKAANTKKRRIDIPDYHLTPSAHNEDGEIIWPAPADQIESARNFILECVAANEKTLIVPDKDADGLTSGSILQKTLVLLGLGPALISVHLLQKGGNIHGDEERAAMAAYNPSYIFILDQGSRKSPPVISPPHKALVIDHHYALDDDLPQHSLHVTACNSPPVSTSSLLTYLICSELHEQVSTACDWLCIMGTHGDLGNTLKWQPPFPDMSAAFKKYTKKAINDAVSLINAPRRTSSYQVRAAWDALTAASGPGDLLSNRTLLAARAEVNAEVERCTHTAPQFSSDAKIAVFRISSAAQIHPVIATRWAGHLSSAKLEVVLVANEGYLPEMVNFSCRVPRSARARSPPVNIIEVLGSVADRAPDTTLRKRLGDSFARGHKEASGGIVPKAEFEELMNILEVGKKSEGSQRKSRKGKDARPQQGNTLLNYFGKK